jgi:alkanesulfonate monooxygenase
MEIGIALSAYANPGWRIPAKWIKEFAKFAESKQFAGVWLAEHIIKPPKREYSRLSPLATAVSVAGATERLPIGTCVVNLPLRNPVMVAHQVASIQYLSENRFTFGVGAGWNKEEFEAVGVPYKERGPRFTEALDLITRLFTNESVTFDGDFYSVKNLSLQPQLSLKPKILVGGDGNGHGADMSMVEPVRERIVQYGDGWIAPPRKRRDLESDWADMREYMSAKGENSNSLKKVALTWSNIFPNLDENLALEKQREAFRGKDTIDHVMEHYLTGTVSDIQQHLRWYEEEGFDTVVVGPTVSEPHDIQYQLQVYSEVFDDFLA